MLDTKLQSEEFKFYFLFFLALTFAFSMAAPISYGDFAIWIAEGRQIIQQGTFYTRDTYSFNATEMHPYPWLSCLLYYFLDSSFSVESILFLHRLIPVMIVAFWLTRYPMLMEKKNIISLVLCISGIGMLIIDRPALLVFPLVPYFYELIDSQEIYRKKIKSLLLLVLWTNLHGSFALFFILLGYKTVLQLIKNPKQTLTKDRILFFFYAFLVTLINPWGLKIYKYILETTAISKTRILTEWQPLYVSNHNHNSEFILFAVATLLLISLVAYRKKFIEFFNSLLPVFIISSVFALRNLPLFFAILPLFWGKHLTHYHSTQGFSPKASNSKIFFHRLVVGLLIIFGIYMFSDYSENMRPMLPQKFSHRYDETSSFRISEYLNNSTGKKIFNDWILGSFFSYSQNNQIFIDTRNIIYSDKIFGDYVKIMLNKNEQAEKMLAEYQIDYVISNKTNALSNALKSSMNWTFIMEDNGYSLFEKK